ncbi:MAG: ABC transporter substrate-binding protein [Inquilinus sp.]|uniref:ABC transporter substrate-binding protein n=1 Tax=Inquilinus sp. TaxID=1932117 RepID=UPI003F3D3A2F
MITRRRTLDVLRRRSGALPSAPLWNAAVDEFAAGAIGRRDLMRYAALLGLAVAGLAAPGARAQTPAGKPGGTVRVGLLTPTGAINPVTLADPPSIGLVAQVGEYLIVDDPDLTLRPGLAESWKSDAGAKVWTVAIRRGVKFHDGRALSARDVVATFERLTDPATGSHALSILAGILSKGGTRQVDDYTVEFRLDAPNGNFPYLISSDTYNAVILPADYAGDFETNFNATGPFKLEQYTPKVGASFVRNPDYWGPKALPDRVEFTFFADEPSQVLAIQAGQVDIINYSPQGGQALLSDPAYRILRVGSSAHTQVHLRTDQGPFQDKRIRQALALTLNREGLVKGLLQGDGVVGNDSPFSPLFPSTDPAVPQRKQDIAKAKALLAEAGVPDGFAVTLTTQKFDEIPDYAVLIQNAARQIGIAIDLNIKDQAAYYGKAVFGQSDWLDSVLGITDYGHRGTPNAVLNAAFRSTGSWNAAHFKNPDYDRLLADYTSALDLPAQRAAAGKLQAFLLEETPVIISYFSDSLKVTSAALSGVRYTAISQLYFDQASFA